MSLPKANKSLGQHFLRDQSVIAKITEDFKEVAKTIVEVGPGPGILTEKLSAHPQELYLFEMDDRFKEILVQHTSEDKIRMGDALEVEWDEFAKDKKLSNIWLVSNLPYNVGSLLLIKFLKSKSISYMTLMFQKEVGEKTVAHPNRGMSSLLALSTTYFETKSLCKVLPGAFQPPPKVDSIVVSYKRIDNPQIPLASFSELEGFLRKIFSQKRKQLGKVLSQYWDKDIITKSLESLSIARERRAETLTLNEVHSLFKEFRKS